MVPTQDTPAAPTNLAKALGIDAAHATSSAAPAPSPASPSTAAAALPAPATPTEPASPALARTTTAAPALESFGASAPTGGASLPGGTAGAALLLLALAVAALVLSRRRRGGTRLVHIVESASLGAKRSLVVARLGDELLVLGTSEGGVSLLATRPASALSGAFRAAPLPRNSPDVNLPAGLAARAPAAGGLAARLRACWPGRAPAPRSAAFEGLLTESVEDVELRRKLASGQAGRAP